MKKAFLVAVSVVFGFCFFLFTYTLFCRILRMPSNFLFDYFESGIKRTSTGESRLSSLIDRTSLTGQLFYWINPFFVVLTLMVFGSLSWAIYKRSSVNRALIVLALSGPFIVVSYAAITGFPFSFPKYWSMALIPFCLVSSSVCFMCINKLARFTKFLPAFLMRPLFFSLLFVVGVFYFLQYVRLSNRVLDNHREGLDLIWSGLFVLLPFLTFTALIFSWKFRKNILNKDVLRGIPSFVFVGVSFMTMTTSLMVSNVHKNAPFSTQYYFSERGLGSVLNYLRNNIASGSILICAKDIGLQSGHKFYEDSFLLTLNSGDLAVSLESNTADYFISRNKWDYSPAVYPAQFDVFANFYTPIDNQPSIDFVIWKRNP